MVGGISAVGAGLYSMGIPKDSIVKYETALKTDQFLLIAHGSAAEVAKTRDIIERTDPVHFSLHSGAAAAAAAAAPARAALPDDSSARLAAIRARAAALRGAAVAPAAAAAASAAPRPTYQGDVGTYVASIRDWLRRS